MKLTPDPIQSLREGFSTKISVLGVEITPPRDARNLDRALALALADGR